MTEARSDRSWSRHAIVIALLCVPAALTVGQRGFYADDHYFLWRAETGGLADALRANIDYLGLLRPVGYALNAVQFEVFGTAAWLHHSGMVLLLLLTGISVYLLARSLLRSSSLGLVAAATFVVIPWHSQMVFWPSASQGQFGIALTVLAGWLFVLSVRTQAAESRRLQLMSLGCYAIGLLSYEHGLSWLVVWPLLAWLASDTGRARDRVHRSLPHMATALGVGLVLAFLAGEGQRQGAPRLSVSHVTASFIELLARSAETEVYLSVAGVRSYHLPTLLEWVRVEPWKPFLLALLLVPGILGVGVAVHRERSAPRFRAASMALTGLVLILAPIGILTLAGGPTAPSRTLYLPSVGIALLVATGAGWIRARVTGGVTRGTITTVLIVGLGGLGLVNATRAEEWTSAWDTQVALERDLLELAASPPQGTLLVVEGAPMTVSSRAFVFLNEYGLRHWVWRIYGRNDLEPFTTSRIGEDGSLWVGAPSSRRSRPVGDAPLIVTRYEESSGLELIRTTNLQGGDSRLAR